MFKSERYSIEVFDDRIEFYGAMPLDELHQWVSMFQEMGFDQVERGYENSTLIVSKSEGKEENVFRAEHSRTLNELSESKKQTEKLKDELSHQKQYIIELNSELSLLRSQMNKKEMEISKLNSHKILLTTILENNHVQVVLED